MSITEIEAAGSPLRADAANVVTLDLERFKGRAEIEFWDLGDYKNRRIHADSVVEWPRTICVAWKVYGTKRVEFASEWGDGRETMLRRVWEVVDKADYITGHNVERFDLRHLNTEWAELGLTAPAPPKVIDTLKEARKVFGAESKTLDALCKRFGVTAKTGKYDLEVARRALAGSLKDQREITTYCKGDVLASEGFVDRLRGWIPSHPHNLNGTANDRPTCNQCWGDRLVRNGIQLANQISYVRWRCEDCGANVGGTRHSRAAITRGVR